AGRLHNKKNLMDELNKIRRTIDKNYPEAKVITMLALDAATGQNGVNQAEVFTKTANVDAVCINKLDGTSKGGVVIAISDKIGLPVKYIGVGEGIDDIMEFDKESFVDAIVDIDVTEAE
ncbi:MAG: signal recognition particle-docking protein FtsY, partial [Clostridia bacterium]|nr:signal recognition particle-docking protein FtsY [Clostridia bacterium]